MLPRFVLLVSLAACAHAADLRSPEWQIKTALLAAPPLERDHSTVLGYNTNGEVVTLRQGTNNLICLADDPKQKGFSVACYYKDLEPLMARGRELRAQGKKAPEIMKVREEDVKSGKLTIPDKSVLNVTVGTVDEATGEVTDLYTRYVIYIPYGTPQTTGIPLAPATSAGPWIMDPGTHHAHIMINPPKATPDTAKKAPVASAKDEHKNHE